MTDRELLEAAAKAAGIEATGYEQTLGLQYVAGSEDSPYTDYWNPLTDDGDALRLAVKLRLVVHVWDDGETVSVAKTLPDGNAPEDESPAWASADAHACGDDHYAATRRAIVRAAAEIGKEI